MTATAPARTHVPLRFPTPLFVSYLIFTVLVWAGVLLGAFALTFFVSLWNEITISAWRIVGQVARWFVLGSMAHLGWTMFELYLTHGRTRRAVYLEALPFIGAFALCAAALYTLTFPLEAAWYGPFGWQQGMGDALYASAFDIPVIALEAAATFLLWSAGGFFVATAWYRNGLLGTAAIAIGLVCVAVSAIAFGEREGPANLLLDRLPMLIEPDGTPDLVMATIVHLVMSGALLGLPWLWLRDMPVHGKSE